MNDLPKTSIFKDDKIDYIEDDVEKIRVRTGMYISYLGSKGALHLVKELVNNNIDEVASPNSPGDYVEIFFDEKANMVTSSDNGRGIDFDEVIKISTKIQSGSKMTSDVATDTAGENGVGLTAVNALSSMLKYTIYRQIADAESQKGIFDFQEGKFIGKKITSYKGAKHGTMFTYVPSTQVLGDCQLDPDEIYTWVGKVSYLVDSNTTIKLSILKSGKEIESITKFKHKNGFVDYMDVLSKEQLVAPISISGKKDDIKVQVVFTYNPKNNEELIDSFANYVNTIDGGVHVNSARYGVTSCLSRLANEMLTDAEKKKFEITNDDCKNGLVMAVNLRCKKPGFASQTKEKCGNDDLFKPIRSIAYNGVLKYFKDNPKELQKVVTYLKRIAKSRLEITKIRKSDMAAFDSFTESTMKNFSPANGHGYKEIYMVEGLSAKGSVNNARDPFYQAVYAFRGLTLNTMKATLAKIWENAEYRTLVKIHGMGIGKEFDLRKSNYQKYIIVTDSDIDGYNITSGISLYFLLYARPVIEAGMLYKAMAPLYKVKDGNGYRYVCSKMEFFEMCIGDYVKDTKIIIPGKGEMNKKELEDFYVRNKTYTDILKELYTYYYTNPDIIEFTVKYARDKNFGKLLNRRFPEIHFEDSCITGSYKGAFQYMYLDRDFDRKCDKLRTLMEDGNQGRVYYDFEDRNGIQNNISAGNILKIADKYRPHIDDRWKGLAGVQPEIFWETVLNPRKRTLTQLTIDDLETDLQKMRALHGDNPELRRALLDNYKLDKDDIDN